MAHQFKKKNRRTLNSLIRGRGAEEVAEEYPHTLDLKSGTAAAVAARTTFHDSWFAQLLESCSISEQIQLVRAIEDLPFPTPKPGESYSMREVAPYTAALQALFEPLPAELRESMTHNQETRDAVYRKLPMAIRNLIKNLCEHSNDNFEDTSLTICDRLAECATLAEKAERVVAAFVNPKRAFKNRSGEQPNKRPRTDTKADDTGKPPLAKLQAFDHAVVDTLLCKSCNKDFDLTKGEDRFFNEKGWGRPVRCKDCRDKRKDQRLKDAKSN